METDKQQRIGAKSRAVWMKSRNIWILMRILKQYTNIWKRKINKHLTRALSSKKIFFFYLFTVQQIPALDSACT